MRLPRPTTFVLLAALTASSVSLAACNGTNAGTTAVVPQDGDPATATYAPALNVDIKSMTKTASGLYYKDLTTGSGATAAAGYTVRVTYTGWLVNGSKFDTSEGRSPAYFEFLLNAGQVIKGWDEGVAGMKVGGKRQLVIPHTLGYGTTGTTNIPGYATLIFEVSLIQVR